MSNTAVIIQILFITIGMVIFGMILNYVLGLRKEALSEMRKKALNVQERMRNAQVLGDYQLMVKTQQESIQFMKEMMKKQVIPICVRILIFIGIFVILGYIYSDYRSGLLSFPLLIFGSGWVAIYIIFSFSISLTIYIIKRLYKKITGKGSKSQSYFRELLGMISPSQQNSEQPFQISSKTQYQARDYNNISVEQKKENLIPKKDSWKDRLED